MASVGSTLVQRTCCNTASMLCMCFCFWQEQLTLKPIRLGAFQSTRLDRELDA